MSGEGESDDSTTIRRKILLSPPMPPRDSMSHDGSPLANLIGQVCFLNTTEALIQNVIFASASNATLAYDQKLATLRSTPTSPQCNRDSVSSSTRTDFLSFSDWQLLASQQIPGMNMPHIPVPLTDS